VKQFTNDTNNDTRQFPQSMFRRIPAMRFALLTTVVAVGALACGKKGDQTQNQTPAAPPAPPAASNMAVAAPTGPVVEVKMTGNGSTKAGFEPSSITIPAGATVRFTNVAGGPHNITFWSDSIPAGGAAALNAGMKNTIDNLSGPFLTQPNETYEVSFANAPKGTYKGYCTPHLTLGMRISIKVQ
jgi:plastocyanin